MPEGWIIPKNIRQIGESQGRIHIYIEDYVATFLSQFAKNLGACMCVGACYGKIYEEPDGINIVIEGAAMDTVRPEVAEQIGSEETYRRAEWEGKNYFAGKKVIGKIIADTETQQVSDARAGQVLRTTGFVGSRLEFMLLVGKEDGIRAFFVSVKGNVEKIEHYYIYYDKNEPMQNYLIHWNENARGISDERKAQIREQEEVQQIVSAKKKEAFPLLECVACLLLVIGCALGIVSINNYQRMKKVEESMVNLAKDFYEGEEIAPVSGENVTGEELPVYIPQVQHQEVQEEETEATASLTTLPDEAVTATEMPTMLPEAVQEQMAPVPTGVETSVEVPVVSYREYIVQQGDTLSSICYLFYRDRSKVDEVCRLNGITDPDTLAIGQKILLP